MSDETSQRKHELELEVLTPSSSSCCLTPSSVLSDSIFIVLSDSIIFIVLSDPIILILLSQNCINLHVYTQHALIFFAKVARMRAEMETMQDQVLSYDIQLSCARCYLTLKFFSYSLPLLIYPKLRLLELATLYIYPSE
jgi:hypothetical protein